MHSASENNADVRFRQYAENVGIPVFRAFGLFRILAPARPLGVGQLVAAVHEELVRPQVMTAVEDLTAREASGVLEVTGSPSGAIYLDGGRSAFARDQ